MAAQTNLEYGPRGLIGALTPQANTTVEPEFAVMWPPGYAMITARLTSPHDAMEDRHRDYWATIELSLDQFANAPLSAVAFAVTGPSYLVGKDEEDALVAADGTRLPRLATSPSYWFGWYAQYPETELVK